MKELYLARHGQTIENLKKIIQGHHGGTLSEEGKSQAAMLGNALQNEGIEIIIAGDLDRQLFTAQIINRYLSLPLIVTPHLRERGAGSLGYVSYTALNCSREQDFGFYAGDGQGVFSVVEPLESVLGRANQALTLLHQRPEQRMLVVSSGWMNSYLANILLCEPLIYHDQDNGCIHRFRLEDSVITDHHINEKIF